MENTTAEKSAAPTRGNNANAEPIKLRKRIGSTTYLVNVRFSDSNRETMEDKLLRMMKREVNDIA